VDLGKKMKGGEKAEYRDVVSFVNCKEKEGIT
jgi:hypothetical protein